MTYFPLRQTTCFFIPLVAPCKPLLANSNGEQASKGHNPFDDFCIDKTFNYIAHHSLPADANEIQLSSICTAYNPDWLTSEYVYNDIKKNIERLIENAIQTRNRYPK